MPDLKTFEILQWLDEPGQYVSDEASRMPLCSLRPSELRDRVLIAEEFSDDNTIFIPKSYLSHKLRFSLKKQGNTKHIKNCQFVILSPQLPIEIIVGSNGANIYVGILRHGAMTIRTWLDSHIAIGCGTSVNYAKIICDNSSVFIGRECMLSDDVLIQSSDQHGIIDIGSHAIVNNSHRSIVVQDHVWIGRRATVMGGITIGRGAIIGTGAVLTKDVPQTSAAAGNPARIVRENVTWSRSPIEIDESASVFLRSITQTVTDP